VTSRRSRHAAALAVLGEVLDEFVERDLVVVVRVHFLHERGGLALDLAGVSRLAARLVVGAKHSLELALIDRPVVVLVPLLESLGQFRSCVRHDKIRKR